MSIQEESISALRQGSVPIPQPSQQVSKKVDVLRSRYPLAGPLLDALRILGCEMVFADLKLTDKHDVGTSGYGTIRFSSAIENLFGFTREVFILFSPYLDLQYRTFNGIPKLMSVLDREPDPRYALLSSPDPRAAEKLDDWNGADPVVVPCPIIQEGNQADALEFIRTLKRRIYQRNSYEVTSPVRDAQFFGRKLLLQEVEQSVRSRRPGVVLGLRKAGKTSLLKEAGRRLTESGEVIFSLRDLESLPTPPSPLVPDLIADLAEDWREVLPSEAGRYLDDIEETTSISAFRRALKRALMAMPDDRIVVLALDEIECLCPPSALDTITPDTEAITQFLGALRSLVQETDNFEFLMAGLTPALVEFGTLYGRHNPLFSWATPHYVQPFDIDDTRDLLVSLGRRMGLQWEPDAIERVHRASGGHAFLMRRLAALIAHQIPVDSERRRVRLHHVERAIPAWERDVTPNLTESMDHVRRYYPKEAQILERLREIGAPYTSENALTSPRIRTLEQMGLLIRDKDSLRVVEFLG